MASGESDWSQEVIAAAFCATKDGQDSNSEQPIEEVSFASKSFILFATVEKNVDFFFLGLWSQSADKLTIHSMVCIVGV